MASWIPASGNRKLERRTDDDDDDDDDDALTHCSTFIYITEQHCGDRPRLASPNFFAPVLRRPRLAPRRSARSPPTAPSVFPSAAIPSSRSDFESGAATRPFANTRRFPGPAGFAPASSSVVPVPRARGRHGASTAPLQRPRVPSLASIVTGPTSAPSTRLASTENVPADDGDDDDARASPSPSSIAGEWNGLGPAEDRFDSRSLDSIAIDRRVLVVPSLAMSRCRTHPRPRRETRETRDARDDGDDDVHGVARWAPITIHDSSRVLHYGPIPHRYGDHVATPTDPIGRHIFPRRSTRCRRPWCACRTGD